MLRQITELVPCGDDTKARRIAVTYIGNTLDTTYSGSYKYVVGYFSSGLPAKFCVVQHDRTETLDILLNLSYGEIQNCLYEKNFKVCYPEYSYISDIFIKRAKEDLDENY
jgi:hypothetical protein